MTPSVCLALRLGSVAALVGACASFGPAQDPKLKPQYDTVSRTVGFTPDPTVVKVDAGGRNKVEIGGFTHYVADRPDVRFNYSAGEFKPGKYILTIYADCDGDATLLIKLPDGNWIANDNGPNAGKNPVVRFAAAQEGTYNIWVGHTEPKKNAAGAFVHHRVEKVGCMDAERNAPDPRTGGFHCKLRRREGHGALRSAFMHPTATDYGRACSHSRRTWVSP